MILSKFVELVLRGVDDVAEDAEDKGADAEVEGEVEVQGGPVAADRGVEWEETPQLFEPNALKTTDVKRTHRSKAHA